MLFLSPDEHASVNVLGRLAMVPSWALAAISIFTFKILTFKALASGHGSCTQANTLMQAHLSPFKPI